MAEGYSELSEKDKSDPSLLTFTTESEGKFVYKLSTEFMSVI